MLVSVPGIFSLSMLAHTILNGLSDNGGGDMGRDLANVDNIRKKSLLEDESVIGDWERESDSTHAAIRISVMCVALDNTAPKPIPGEH